MVVTPDPGPAMLDIPFTPAHEQALRSQAIDATHPGAVLHDFGVVLDYIGAEGGVPAGGKYNLLPLEAIPVLDERLARPLRLDLKRPQLRSHPYLQGLHLLGRASGLLAVLPTALTTRIVALAFAGQLAAADQLIDELRLLTEAMQVPTPPYGPLHGASSGFSSAGAGGGSSGSYCVTATSTSPRSRTGSPRRRATPSW